MTTRTFKGVSRRISPNGIITLRHTETQQGTHILTLVNYGADCVNRDLTRADIMFILGAADQTLRQWITKNIKGYKNDQTNQEGVHDARY